MSEAPRGEVEALRAEVEALRHQLEAATRRANRALASHQQHALAMEVIRQKNADLDDLAAALEQARAAEAERARELAATNERLRERERDNDALIVRLRECVEQLSTPILQVGVGVLAVPIVGAVDEERAAAITERTLTEVAARRARHLVIDLTGVATVDAATLRHILGLQRAVRLLGARCVVCGLRPAVARAAADLELGPHELESAGNLHDALAAISHRPAPRPQRPA